MLKRNRVLVLPTRGRAPGFRVGLRGERLSLAATGSWTIREAATLDHELKRLTLPIPPSSDFQGEIDVSAVEQLDTAGAFLLLRTVGRWGDHGIDTQVVGAREHHGILLDEVAKRSADERPRREPPNPIVKLLDNAGQTFTGIVNEFAVLTGFLGAFTSVAGRMIVKPWRFRSTSFVHHLEHAGLRAIPIIALICLLIGAVVMQQSANQLRSYGAEPFAVNMLGILALREVGVLLTAIMIAGRSGSAFTAEIGSMKMREEIDAMRTLGIDPIETLVLPRVLALIIALPLLTFVGDLMCLVGGGLIAYFHLGMDVGTYIMRLQDAIEIRHFFAGMIKTPFAAIIIGLVGCVEGMRVAGSAESLGQRVTSAVVKSIFLVIILDALFALFLSAIGI